MKLASYAASDENSRGRSYPEPPPAYRSGYQRDRDRVIHSAAFRRLEYKTQVFVNHESDLFRTRLTHSIEVSQIARSIARALALNEDLCEAIALAHDLGHTPFGHAGQDALNECMREYGGFEHNLQSLRVVDELEEKYAAFNGLNLSFETREGILKHCSKGKAKLLGAVGERFINGQQPSLEAQLTDLADAIAYNSHDVDDGLRAGMFELQDLAGVELLADVLDGIRQQHGSLSVRRTQHEIVRQMINLQVSDLIKVSQASITKADVADIEAVRHQPQRLIHFSETMQAQHLQLKRFLRENMYRHYRVRRMSAKAAHIISRLFEVFMNDIRMLSPEHARRAREFEQRDSAAGRARAVADYIAGMTDRYAIKEYNRLFDPTELT
jgi:dGTPase